MASPSREDLLKDMSPKDQEALAKFLYAEQQKSMFYKQAGEYTDLCWDKCITKIRPQLDKADLVCVENCVQRFMDTTELILHNLAQ